MEWLKNRKNRLLVSIFAAMAVAMLVAGETGYGHGSRPLAWWGTMYPKFCFAESREEEPRKIGFWLAEVLDW